MQILEGKTQTPAKCSSTILYKSEKNMDFKNKIFKAQFFRENWNTIIVFWKKAHIVGHYLAY